MLQKYINNLIDNIPNNIINTKISEKTDLILSGGLFNGSYLLGALFFLKEIERRKYITIDRISACSVSSVSALLYHINALDLSTEIYEILFTHLKQNYNLNIFETIFDIIRPRIPADICKTMENRVFISYYNVKKGKKNIKCKYRNVADIFETIKYSCFVPFIINGDMLYKNKYMDGVTPYFFPSVKNKKSMYLDLFGSDKFKYSFSIKNENTNFHRIMTGILDIHLFFIKVFCQTLNTILLIICYT